MDPANITVYQLVKYHIELTESLEYTLITYKYDNEELVERFKFLNNEYKNGTYKEIITKLFKHSKKLTGNIKRFLNLYNPQNIKLMVDDHNLTSRINYNRALFLAYLDSNNLLQAFLKNEELKKVLETDLIKLVNTCNKHFILFFLFNSLNLFISTKAIILEGDTLYSMDKNTLDILTFFIEYIGNSLDNKSLINESLDLIKEKKKFDEEDAYELLNKVSLECIKEEKNLYNDFESFTNKLEKSFK